MMYLIVGAFVGAFAGVLLTLGVLYWRKRKQRREREQALVWQCYEDAEKKLTLPYIWRRWRRYK